MYRSVTLTRGHVVSSILAKATRLNLSEAKRSAAVTLMSTDMDGIQSGIVIFHEIWASIIELAIGIYLLANLVGKASFLVVIPSSSKISGCQPRTIGTNIMSIKKSTWLSHCDSLSE